MTKAAIVSLARELHGSIDLPLVLAIIEHESSFDPRAFAIDKNGGSYGLTQLNLATAKDRGFAGKGADLFDPRINLIYGVRQLAWIEAVLRSHSAWSLSAEIAAYNEGVTAALRGNPDPRYVAAVLAARSRWLVALTGAPA